MAEFTSNVATATQGIIPGSQGSFDVGFFATKVNTYTDTNGHTAYKVDIIKYDNGKKENPVTIGSRDTTTGKLTLNDNATTKNQRYIKNIEQTTKHQAKVLKENHIGPLTKLEKDAFNTATGNPTTASVTNESITSFATLGSTTISDGADSRRKSYGDYCYPEDIKTNKQDRIRFVMKYSEGTKIEASIAGGVKPFQRKVNTINGSVTLPIQAGIRDTNAVSWAGGKLNPLQALGASATMGLMESVREEGIDETLKKVGGTVEKLKKQVLGGGGDLVTLINTQIAQQAVGAQNLLSRTTGAIINPNLEMLFDAPQLRPFSFQFKLSPRDEDEAKQVKNIIRFFKQGMSVKTSSTNVFLKAPNIFDIRYITYDGNKEVDHPSINRIKTCALLSCGVDYTPDNSYMTYDDPRRTMTSYGLSLQFNELDPVYEDDYTNLSNEDIGY